jgi:hypothetical protein
MLIESLIKVKFSRRIIFENNYNNIVELRTIAWQCLSIEKYTKLKKISYCIYYNDY